MVFANLSCVPIMKLMRAWSPTKFNRFPSILVGGQYCCCCCCCWSSTSDWCAYVLFILWIVVIFDCDPVIVTVAEFNGVLQVYRRLCLYIFRRRRGSGFFVSKCNGTASDMRMRRTPSVSRFIGRTDSSRSLSKDGRKMCQKSNIFTLLMRKDTTNNFVDWLYLCVAFIFRLCVSVWRRACRICCWCMYREHNEKHNGISVTQVMNRQKMKQKHFFVVFFDRLETKKPNSTRTNRARKI